MLEAFTPISWVNKGNKIVCIFANYYRNNMEGYQFCSLFR